MTTINANQQPLNTTVTLGASLVYLADSSPSPVTVQSITGAGRRLGGITHNIEPLYRPEPLPLSALSDTPGINGLLLEVDANRTLFGYKGSNQTGDGDIIIFYDSNKNYITAEFTEAVHSSTDGRFHLGGNFPISQNIKYILFGGRFSSLDIEEITLS